MKKTKYILPCVLLILLLCFILTGCMSEEEMMATNYLSVNSAVGYLYDEEQEVDNEIDAKSRGFTTARISNSTEWDTPTLRYSEIHFDVTVNCSIFGLAFEIKTDITSGTTIRAEAQIYKEAEHPEGWDDLTQEEKEQWEQENCIIDRRFDSVTLYRRYDALSFSFDETKASLDPSYQIRIIFTSIDGKAVTDSSNYLKNFTIDNFLVITQNG